jgi:CubicO group peptidase (beta-lactamase class C family)
MAQVDERLIDEIIISALNGNALAGVAAGIVSNGELAYAKGFGIADAARAAPVTPNTSFRIGSISKTLTGVGLMQLWEEGRFKLDDPVRQYLKSYRLNERAGAPPVTFRHLLTHTGGIGELRGIIDLVRPVIGLGAKPGQLPKLSEYYRGGLGVEVAPGAKWAYANHGFATLGQLIEDISGRPFSEYMTERVFAPLGMNRSDYLLSDRIRGSLAQGYQLRRGMLKPLPYLEIAVGPAGSVFSSVSEMAKYVIAIIGGGANDHGRVLKPETVATMTSPHYQVDPRLPAMGLAFMIGSEDGNKVIGHNGGWPGFLSSMWIAPERGLGVISFINTTRRIAATSPLGAALMRAVLGLPRKPGTAGVPILEHPFLWPELCGKYRPSRGLNTNARGWMFFGGQVKVGVRQDHLALFGRLGPLRTGTRLVPADANDPMLFRASLLEMEVDVLFKRNAVGRIESVNIVTREGAFFTLYKR